MKYTAYFLYTQRRPDRTSIKMDWIQEAIDNPIRTEVQADGRIKKWVKVDEEDKFLRVILLEDGKQSIMPFSTEDLRIPRNDYQILFRH